MQDKDTGGPAFPTTEENYSSAKWSFDGMSLRDYFAAKAMHALVSLPDACGSVNFFATEAYRYADAMLEARK
jgi:hypothetical protein